MLRQLIRLRNRNQMTLPAEFVERLSLGPNALVELVLNPENNCVELRRAEVIRAGTPRAKQAEELALKDVREGKFSEFESAAALARNMEETRAKEELQERIDSLQQQMDGILTFLREMNLNPASPQPTAFGDRTVLTAGRDTP